MQSYPNKYFSKTLQLDAPQVHLIHMALSTSPNGNQNYKLRESSTPHIVQSKPSLVLTTT